MRCLIQDLVFAVRLAFKHRTFTAVVVLTLGLGIGVNTSIFSMANAFLFSPLPYPAANRLVRIDRVGPRKDAVWHSVPNFLAYQQRNEVFEEVVACSHRGASLGGGDQLPERLDVMEVTGNFFAALAMAPELGRIFLPEEDQPSNADVVVLSHGLYVRRFGGDARIIGQTVRLDGEPVTVVGVMPSRFDCPRLWGRTDAWRTIAFTPGEKQNRGRFYLEAFGRLKPRVKLATAQANMSTIAAQLARENPRNNPAQDVRLVAMKSSSEIEPFVLYFLLALVGIVLLIACVNVASLQMVRTAGRRRELAIRTALGAGRPRLLGQLLMESQVLALAGGVAGLALAVWVTDLLAYYLGQQAEVPEAAHGNMRVDMRVLGYTLFLSVLTGLWFGVAPALRGSRPELTRDLKEGGGGASIGRTAGRARRLLVVAEVAGAFVLLVGCGLAVRVLTKHLAQDPGFRTDRLLLAQISLPTSKYSDRERRRAFYRQTLNRLGQLPGVQHVAATSSFPIWKTVQSSGIGIAGQPNDGTGPRLWAYEARVSPQFFPALGIAIKAGRGFTDRDRAGAPPVAIINETMARRFWSGEDAVGERFYTSGEWREIIGVVSDLDYPGSLESERALVHFYLPLDQDSWTFATLVLHTRNDPSLLARAVKEALAEIDPDLAVFRLSTGEDAMGRAVTAFQLVLALLSSFAFLGLTLAAIGIYGVVSYGATQRTNEIGIRMALGAGRSSVLWLMLAQGMKPVFWGMMIGVAGALVLTSVVRKLLVGISPADPITWTVVSVVLLATAALACYLPASRAARVDPTMAVRYE